WFGDEARLLDQEWLPPLRDTATRIAMKPLWSLLAEHAALHVAWRSPTLRTVHAACLRNIASWSSDLDTAPQTLIHNDFNPRNVAIRRRNGRLTLCAFDWELATIGAPQRDVGEFLCFVCRPAPRTHLCEDGSNDRGRCSMRRRRPRSTRRNGNAGSRRHSSTRSSSGVSL